MVLTNEEMVVGVVIRVLKPVKMPERYKTMFHGETNLKIGRAHV